jgi:glyoxylase-like metal-dependent hydrolase (beta-lactamase superfamily II)
MKNSWITVCALISLMCGSAIRKDSIPPLEVYRIDTGMANVYLIKGERLVMIDTSVPPKREFVEEKIRALGFKPEDISLLIVTHGHGDHAGNARYFQEKYGIPVAGGAGDADKFQRGSTDLGKAESIGILARLIRSMSDKPYPSFKPDVVVDQEIDLAKYGVQCKIKPLPGHTPGSLVVITGESAFVGDLIRGGVVFSQSPTEHFYHENRAQAREQLKILAQSGVRLVFPGHFGPLAIEDVKSFNE